MYDKFSRSTFETVDGFLIESVTAPKVKAGGSSNSDIINRYFTSLSKDLSLLSTRTNLLAARSNRVENAVSAQSAYLSTLFQSLSSRVNAASGFTQVYADFFTGLYLNSGSTTANVNETFGQVMLPSTSITNLLVQTDIYGNNYVPDGTIVSYSNYNSTYSAAVPADSYIADPDGIFMLKNSQLWIRDVPAGSTTSWVKINIPLQYRGLNPNILEIWPFPPFAMNIASVSYRMPGVSNVPWTNGGTFVLQPNGTYQNNATGNNAWNYLDMSYCPNYSSSTMSVNNAGPIRLVLPGDPIAELAICFTYPSTLTSWGVKAINLYHYEYAQTATLAITNPYGQTFNSYLLQGGNSSLLNQQTTVINGSNATVTMSSTDSTVSPLITGIIFGV